MEKKSKKKEEGGKEAKKEFKKELSDLKPKNPIVLVGFPGFGLVGVIATEYLIDHLKTKEIGKYWFEDLPATIAIHDSQIINPISVFYDEKSNIMVIHSISGANGIEWKAADLVLKIARDVNAKEIICLEGVGSAKIAELMEGEMANTTLGEEEKTLKSSAFFYASKELQKKKLLDAGAEELKESIIMGPTAAILLKSDIPVVSLFAETSSNLPDSKAAARLIEVIDKYLDLKVDFKPLLDMAKKFEEKLKNIIEKSTEVQDQQEKKNLSYVG